MALVVKDRVRETTTTTGTGTVTLAGAVAGFQSFSVIGNGNTTYYTITNNVDWEVGIGTYTSSGTTLSRNTILESSNGGAAVNFGAGTKDVFVTYPAEKSVYQDGASIAAGTSVLTVANGGTGATSLTSGYMVKGNGTSAVTASVVYDNGTNVGIGTSSPPLKLSLLSGVTTNNVSTPVVMLGSDRTDYYASINSVRGSASTYIGLAFSTSNNAAPAEAMRIDPSGNVGIGTTSPTARLTVTAATAFAGVFNGTNTYVDIIDSSVTGRLQTVDSVFFVGTATSGKSLGFKSGAGVEAMRITSSGNVGIGTTGLTSTRLGVSVADGSYQLGLAGTSKGLRLRSDTGDFKIEATDQTLTSSFQPLWLAGSNLQFAINATERMRLDSSGNLGIGNTPSGTYKLEVTGAIYGSSMVLGAALPIASGGTGATTAATARTNLGLATVASSGSFTDLTNKPGIQSNGQQVVSTTSTLSASTYAGTNILVTVGGITLTFPSTGYASGQGLAISNISGSSVTLSFPGGSDISTTLPNGASLFAFCDGGGFWRGYSYSVASPVALGDFTGANQSLATAGYQKFPGGLIMNWGSTSVAANTSTTASFSTTFPTACIAVGFGYNAGLNDGDNVAVNISTTSAISLINGTGGTITIKWMAFGY